MRFLFAFIVVIIVSSCKDSQPVYNAAAPEYKVINGRHTTVSPRDTMYIVGDSLIVKKFNPDIKVVDSKKLVPTLSGGGGGKVTDPSQLFSNGKEYKPIPCQHVWVEVEQDTVVINLPSISFDDGIFQPLTSHEGSSLVCVKCHATKKQWVKVIEPVRDNMPFLPLPTWPNTPRTEVYDPGFIKIDTTNFVRPKGYLYYDTSYGLTIRNETLILNTKKK